jgi:hypothetical protein
MKHLHTKTLKDGRKHMLIEFQPNEEKHLIVIPFNCYWKLGYPLDDQIIESHHLKDIQRVAWDAYSQEWVDV